MPVLVTAADAPLGARLVTRLLAEGGEVRAYCSGVGDVSRLRGAGAMVATGDLDDEGRLESAMAQVHTVVHLGSGLLGRSVAAIERDASVVVRAAANAGVRRLVVRTLAGVDRATDPLRTALARVEALVREGPVPSVVLRPSLVLEPQVIDALAVLPLEEDAFGVEVAAVRPDDLIELVVAFDAMRSTAHEGHVVFSADGRRREPLGRVLVAAVAPTERGGRYVGRRFVSPSDLPLLVGALPGPWTTSADDPLVFDAWAFTGLQPAPVTAPTT